MIGIKEYIARDHHHLRREQEGRQDDDKEELFTRELKPCKPKSDDSRHHRLQQCRHQTQDNGIGKAVCKIQGLKRFDVILEIPFRGDP